MMYLAKGELNLHLDWIIQVQFIRQACRCSWIAFCTLNSRDGIFSKEFILSGYFIRVKARFVMSSIRIPLLSRINHWWKKSSLILSDKASYCSFAIVIDLLLSLNGFYEWKMNDLHWLIDLTIQDLCSSYFYDSSLCFLLSSIMYFEPTYLEIH